ncbi:MAG: hypothetical protein N2558_04905 [Patescibacteria group bacterium]|nr:hypothetical protein [Patescibacteria group bacterium]
MGKKLKDFFKKLGQGAQKALDGLKKAGEAAVNTAKEAALLTAFMPLMPIALIYLKRRGITGLKKPSDIVRAVYQEMKKKSFGADGIRDVFDYSLEDFGYSLEQFGLVAESEEYGAIPVTPEMITAVIQFLKGIFDSIKKKKERGEPLSEDEKAIDSQAEKINQQLTEAKNAAQELLAAEKKSGSDNKKYLIIGVVALLLILIFIFLFKRK